MSHKKKIDSQQISKQYFKIIKHMFKRNDPHPMKDETQISIKRYHGHFCWFNLIET